MWLKALLKSVKFRRIGGNGHWCYLILEEVVHLGGGPVVGHHREPVVVHVQDQVLTHHSQACRHKRNRLQIITNRVNTNFFHVSNPDKITHQGLNTFFFYGLHTKFTVFIPQSSQSSNNWNLCDIFITILTKKWIFLTVYSTLI